MKEIEDILGIDNVKYNEKMSKHTSFGVGGPADIFAKVDSIEKLEKILEICKKENIKITIIGNGSNVLVNDEGIRGIVIKYTANNLEIDGEEVVCSSGLLNSILAQKLLEHELSGFEFAAGIPGTIAGAIYMNAGAFGEEIEKIVQYVKFIDIDTEEIKILHKKDINFSYRKSIFQKLNCVILEIGIKLNKDKAENIQNKMEEYKKIRKENQPLELKNAGSIFKRGDNYITAKLIDEAGLKGHTIGGAQISEKHAGFIVNLGNATAKDIIELIEYVKKVVYDKFGKKLETEIKII